MTGSNGPGAGTPIPVVDVFTSLPTPERIALEIRSWGTERGYRQMFGELWRRQLGLEPEVVDQVAELPADGYLERASGMLEPHLPPLDQLLDLLRAAGIVRAVVHAPLIVDVAYPNDATAALVARAPDLLTGFVRVDPSKGEAAAEELVRGVTELGLSGATITPFWHGVSCTDPVVAPLFEAAASLGVPVWMHTSMNWQRARPLELEHPRHVDVIAGRYPTVPILCGHAGWPWVLDLVVAAWRHPNVYIDVSAFRPKHLFVAGSGWEPLAYYGARTVRDRLVYGSTWTLLGRSPGELVDEARATPWPEPVKRAWLHDNAARVLGLPDASPPEGR